MFVGDEHRTAEFRTPVDQTVANGVNLAVCTYTSVFGIGQHIENGCHSTFMIHQTEFFYDRCGSYRQAYARRVPGGSV